MNVQGLMSSIFIAALACGSAVAQEVRRPIIHVWQAGPGPDSGSFPDMTRMVRADLVNYATGGWIAADTAAHQAVEQVHLRLNLPSNHPDHLESDRVCLTFDGGFARYQSDTDAGGGFFESPLRFFQEADRLRTVEHPTGSDIDFFPQQTESEGRTYRHPFLRNADPDPQVAKLKGWMQAFVTEFKAYRDANYPGEANPTHFYLDMEATKGWTGANPASAASSTLRMLSALANDTDLDPAVSRIWTGKVLPSYFGIDVTLDDLYQAECEPLLGQSQRGDITNAINDALAPNSDFNRPVMLWWDSVLRRAEDAVYANCFYEVVHAAFPAQGAYPGCTTANYDSVRMDGVQPTTSGGQAIPNTGWYLGSDDTHTLVNGVDVFPARIPKNTLPRGRILEWYIDGSRFWKETTGVWDVTRQYTGGDMNAPVLYHLSRTQQWHTPNQWPWPGELGYGVDSAGHPIPCHQQPNLYVGSHLPPNFQYPDRRVVLETLQESSMRIFRTRMDACIDSNGGHHEDTLAPWVYAAGIEIPDAASDMFTRRELSMLRAYNVPEVQLFQWKNMDPGSPVTRPEGVVAWAKTQKIIDQVYAPRVSNYSGASSSPPYSVAPAPNSDDLSRLEFTLKDASGSPRIVDLASFDNHTSTAPATYAYTSLQVDFSGLQDYSTQVTSNQPLSGNGYQVVVEGRSVPIYPATNATGLTTSIAAFNWKNSSWQWIRMVDPVEDDLPQAVPPRFSDSIAAATWTADGSFRITCDLRANVSGTNGPEYVAKDVGAVAPDGTLRLLIVQRRPLLAGQSGGGSPPNDQAWRFGSMYDLVQVVPFPYVAPPPPPYAGPRHPGEVFGNPPSGPDYSSLYTANPTIPGSATTIFEASKLDAAGSTPVHYVDWHANFEAGPGRWPQFCPSEHAQESRNTRLLNTTFSLPASDTNRQYATARFTAPIWTDAPLQTDPSLQPYAVWLYFVFDDGGTQVWQWRDVTDAMDVQISRDPQAVSSSVVISSDATQTLPAGYYALVLNITRPLGDPAVTGEPYAVYCSGSLANPGQVPKFNAYGYDPFGNLVPIVQYNFRLYPDCDDSGCIDTADQQCNMTGLTICPADLDNGFGVGVHDGGVDINDLLYFLEHFEIGDFHADLDNGTGTGTIDGGVDINDLLFFLNHFEMGC